MTEILLLAILAVLVYIAYQLKKIAGNIYWLLHWKEKELNVGDFAR